MRSGAEESYCPMARPITTKAQPQRGLRKPQVLEIRGSGHSKLYADIAAGLFPAPIKDGKASVWLEDEVAECGRPSALPSAMQRSEVGHERSTEHEGQKERP